VNNPSSLQYCSLISHRLISHLVFAQSKSNDILPLTFPASSSFNFRGKSFSFPSATTGSRIFAAIRSSVSSRSLLCPPYENRMSNLFRTPIFMCMGFSWFKVPTHRSLPACRTTSESEQIHQLENDTYLCAEHR
jgi:hypothetical protein